MAESIFNEGDLEKQIDTLSDQIGTLSTSLGRVSKTIKSAQTWVSVVVQNCAYIEQLGLLNINALITTSQAAANGNALVELPTGMKFSGRYDYAFSGGSYFILGASGGNTFNANASIPAGTYALTLCVFVSIT